MHALVDRGLLTITEIGMLVYWLFAGLVAIGLIVVQPQLMYADYTDSAVIAWNWSFLPIDVLFAISGLSARYLPLNSLLASKLEVFSLSLMFCAGLMAISYWVIVQFYDNLWWGLNIWLMVLPVYVAISTYKKGAVTGHEAST